MTDRTTLEALLARVLEGAGPDRELDAEIALTLGGWDRKWCANELPSGWYWRRGDYSWTAEGDGYPSNYSASLDAALTLVPPGYDWVRRTLDTMALVRRDDWFTGMTQVHPEPCRALIAACLKARMEAQGE